MKHVRRIRDDVLFEPSFQLKYKGEEYTGDEAKEKMKKLDKHIKRFSLPYCFTKRNVGFYRFQVAPLVGRGFQMHQCKFCQKISMKLVWMS